MVNTSFHADRRRAASPEDWAGRYEALESRRDNELAALLRIGLAMAASPEAPGLFQAVYQSLGSAVDLTFFAAALVDEAAGQIHFPVCVERGAMRPESPVDLYRDGSLVALAVRLRQPLTSADDGSSFHAPHLAPGVPLPLSHLAVPLMSQGRALGALAAGSPLAGAYGEAEARLFNLTASLVSLGVEKARLYEAVARHARSLEERVIARTAELESEKVRFESTVQSLGEGLILFDLDQSVSFANAAAEKLLGLPLEVLLGLSAETLLQTPDLRLAAPDEAGSRFRQALGGVEAYPTLTVTRLASRAAPDGWPPDPGGRDGIRDNGHAGSDLSLRLFPVRDRTGLLLGRGLILQDITREREMDRMKDELVNVVSHELRTPMASVLGFTELLLTRDFPEAKRRHVIETIHQEAERLSALINDFLDLRRLEAGKQMMTLGEVHLAEAVQSVAAGFALVQPQHTLRLDLPPDLPPVRADPQRLGQALRNLVANAFKYSPRGGCVTVAAQVRGEHVCLTVTDEGLGLPSEVIPQLFQRFYRVDSSDRREIGGTGLGLAIVKEIVHAHGGQVWAESPGPGLGSTFGFSLPLAAAPAGDAFVDAGPSEAPPEGYILLVEDDAGAAALTREHLESAGLRVVAVSQPEAARGLLRRRAPAGVVLDLCLPEAQQGWSLLADLRRQFPAGEVPIVVTSVLDEDTKGRALGATEYLVKPFDPRRLTALLTGKLSNTVLVVDDDEPILYLTRAILEKSGFRVVSASGGRAALAQLSTALPDMMIVDLTMPGMDGFEVLEKLRALPGGKAVPALVVTARLLDGADNERLHRHGAFLLTKGEFTAVRLRAAVEQALRERWAEERSHP